MQQYPGAEARAGCRMSSSITLPLRTFTKGPPLFSSAGWPESSGDLSASVLQCWITVTHNHTWLFTWLLGIQTQVLRLARQERFPTDQNNSSPSLHMLCSDLSVLKPTMACVWRSQDNLQESIPCSHCVGSGGWIEVAGLHSSAFTHCPLTSPRSFSNCHVSFINTFWNPLVICFGGN